MEHGAWSWDLGAGTLEQRAWSTEYGAWGMGAASVNAADNLKSE